MLITFGVHIWKYGVLTIPKAHWFYFRPDFRRNYHVIAVGSLN